MYAMQFPEEFFKSAVEKRLFILAVAQDMRRVSEWVYALISSSIKCVFAGSYSLIEKTSLSGATPKQHQRARKRRRQIAL